MERKMRTTIPAACVLVGVLSSSVSASAQTRERVGVVPNAPIGHLQPRANGFTPGSVDDQAEQERLSLSNAEQQKREGALDKKLNICRC